MSRWVDFKALRESLSFKSVLDHYKVKLTAKRNQGGQAQGFCPLPGHGGNRRSASFSVNLSRGIWQCFGCGRKGNVLDFAVYMEGLSPRSTADTRKVAVKLQGIFGPRSATEPALPFPGAKREQAQKTRSPIQTERAQARTGPPVRINEPLDFRLKDLRPDHPYLTRRKLQRRTVEHFGLGFCARGMMAGRIAIPIHNETGQLVGYAGRIVDDSAIDETTPKYKLPSKREREGVVHEFHKSKLVYNLHRLPKPVPRLVIVEGYPSVWWLHQAGIEEVVALMGSSCSPEQAAIVVKHTVPNTRVFVLPDGDQAGERFAQSVFAALGPYRFMRWVHVRDGRQPTDCEPKELTKLLRI